MDHIQHAQGICSLKILMYKIIIIKRKSQKPSNNLIIVMTESSNARNECRPLMSRLLWERNSISTIEGQKPHMLFHRLKGLFKNENMSAHYCMLYQSNFHRLM